ncbi:hypothetical protein GS399_04395 [Pedobacter sp. HMF7647]|uniref:Capsule assembly Wzi family protein n=1 Tax=Hufsiella arboris TaxID=2695275 RepID=A0A7K1Y6Y3_9SPHI|nr:capsule assembly Wzi family protein [Hufsiella arboris]MXV50200.1 hypothetical protein [Hufsiella arboris]
MKNHLKKLLFSLNILTVSYSVSFAQNQIKFNVGTEAVITGDHVPFWMRSNKYGSVPIDGLSAGFTGSAIKDYDTTKTSIFDWGAGFEGRANVGGNSNLTLIQGYAKAKLWIFQLKAGRTTDVMGLNGDTTLSSGNFSMSGNALGIPKVEISIPEYYAIPIFGKLFSVKGNLAHGWFGRVNIPREVSGVPMGTSDPKTYLNQLSFYMRLGKPNWRLQLYGGVNHQAMWGSEAETWGKAFKLSPIETFYYATLGKSYGGRGVPKSKIGNQLGSIDLGFDYNFNAVKLSAYRQSIYDVGALSRLANIADGLNGIALHNRRYEQENSSFQWKSFLFELLYTKDQAGEFGSKHTLSGDEDYYNNFFYQDGWTYKGAGIGTPLITRKEDARQDLPSVPGDAFINNRVVAFHTGFICSIADWSFLTKLSYSMNYGTFGTSPEGHTTGVIKPRPLPPADILFGQVNQFSGYLEANKSLKNNFNVGAALAVDQGKLLYNSTGIILKVSKSFSYSSKPAGSATRND